MLIIWSRGALWDLREIREFIRAENPSAAQRVVRKIREAVKSLKLHPHKGRMGQIFATREMVIPDLPYIVVYQPSSVRIDVVRVIHTARQWPNL